MAWQSGLEQRKQIKVGFTEWQEPNTLLDRRPGG
jgi:hypothetical protein